MNNLKEINIGMTFLTKDQMKLIKAEIDKIKRRLPKKATPPAGRSSSPARTLTTDRK
jgi:hypothetical protein